MLVRPLLEDGDWAPRGDTSLHLPAAPHSRVHIQLCRVSGLLARNHAVDERARLSWPSRGTKCDV